MSEEKDNNSMLDENFEEMLASSFDYSYTPPRRGEIREATILQIDDREIIVDLRQAGWHRPLTGSGADGRQLSRKFADWRQCAGVCH